MCFDLDSEPPIPRIAGAAVSHEDLVLTAADGNTFAAFLADARRAPRRRASSSSPTCAASTTSTRSSRFASPSAATLGDRLRLLRPHRGRVQARRRLRVHAARRADDRCGSPGGRRRRDRGAPRAEAPRRSSSIGLLFRRPRVVGRSGVRARPGRLGRVLRRRRPASEAARASSQRAGEIACPILALQAGDDQTSRPRTTRRSSRRSTEAGVEHEIVVYDGAPHSFFDRKQEEFAEASDDAWQRTLEFIAQHS